MNNIIELEFPADIHMLAGNKLGVEIFNTQVKDKIDYSKINIIKFPVQIKAIAISFVKGLTSTIPEEDFIKHFRVVANGSLADKFMEDFLF